MKDSALLTVIAAARRLGLSEDRVRQLANVGTLPSVRTTTGVRLFTESDVEQLAEQRAREKAS